MYRIGTDRNLIYKFKLLETPLQMIGLDMLKHHLIIKENLKKGMIVDALFEYNYNPQMGEFYYNVIQMFLKHGANPDEDHSSVEYLYSHKNRCKYDLFNDIKKGGDLEHFPLHWAIKYRDYKLVTLLLYYGADPNRVDCNGDVPLHKIKTIHAIDIRNEFAVENRENVKKIVNDLLKVGANPEIKNRKGYGITGRENVFNYLRMDWKYKMLY